MNILALDTSTDYCSVALWRHGDVDAQEAHAGQRHSELLLPMVDGVLRRHGMTVKDLGGIAFGEGPGSFTGLRIACGVTQGLAFGAGLRVVGVSTLLAMAEATGAERAVCCLDARMGEIYHGAFARAEAGWKVVCDPGLWAPSEAPELPEGSWTGCGSGFTAHEAALRLRYGKRLTAVLPGVRPHAKDIARLAAAEFEKGRGVPAELAVPVYLRDRVALKMGER